MLQRWINIAKGNIKLGKNNHISPYAKLDKYIEIGDNNYISPNVSIKNNVKIGSNNYIYDNTIIYENCVIGDNNYFYPDSRIGYIPSCSKNTNYLFDLSLYEGVVIENNNLFHCKTVLQAGIKTPTIVNNNNKLLGEVSVGHNVKIEDNVIVYPGSMIGGSTILKNSATIGMCAVVNQKLVLGQYSMIGSNSTAAKNIFPYYIYINNKMHRINKMKTPNYVDKVQHDIFLEINNNIQNKDYNLNNYQLDNNIKADLSNYIDSINEHS
tara:strand:- start:4087 stop:4887 length:801 start_codon:yes stop_codon:yes gene_type:complete